MSHKSLFIRLHLNKNDQSTMTKNCKLWCNERCMIYMTQQQGYKVNESHTQKYFSLVKAYMAEVSWVMTFVLTKSWSFWKKNLAHRTHWPYLDVWNVKGFFVHFSTLLKNSMKLFKFTMSCQQNIKRRCFLSITLDKLFAAFRNLPIPVVEQRWIGII